MRTMLMIVLGAVLLFGCASQKAGPAANDSVAKADDALDKAGTGVQNVSVPPAMENKTDETVVEEENTTVVYTPPPEPDYPIERFEIRAKDYAYTPSSITVTKGSRVIIKVTAVDRAYGFAIMDFGVNQLAGINETVEVSFVASKAGTFEIKNTHITSGAARDMKGTLIVQ